MRDTDADWIRIAEIEPYFGVLASPEYLRASIDNAAIDRFYASGRADVEHAVSVIRKHLDAEFDPALAVDFGSGVGRLSLAMRAYARRVVGVDVAPAMRDLAGEAAAAKGLSDIEFTDVPPTEGVDWVNSLIVFQHIPAERGYGLLVDLARSVRAGGVVSVHLTSHRDASHMHEIARDVGSARYDGLTMTVFTTVPNDAVGSMSMYDYDLGRVLALLTSLLFRNFWLEHTNHGGVHGYWIFSRRDGNSAGS